MKTTLKLFLALSALFFCICSYGQSVSLSPDNGEQGDGFLVTVTGTGTSWSSSHCVELSDGVSTFSFVGTASSASQLTGTINIPIDANASSNYDVTVYDDNSGACSGSSDGTCMDCFTVNAAPSISLSPDTGEQNSSFTVTVTGVGTSWSSSHCVEFSDGVSTFNFVGTFIATSTISGTLNIPPGANISANYDVKVYDDNLGNCSGDNDGYCVDCFEVTMAIPVVSISPDSGNQGDSFGVTVSGTNTTWASGTTHCVELSDGVSTFTFTGTANASQELTGTLDIPPGANASGNYDITVYDNDSGTCTGLSDGTCMDCFTVNAAPVITIMPNNGQQNSSFGVTITGMGTTWSSSHCVEIFDGVSTFSFIGTAIATSTITGTLSIPPGANISANYDVRVYDDNLGNCSGINDGYCVDCFEVTTAVPVVSISPDNGNQGTSFGVTVSGTNTSWASGTMHCVELTDGVSTFSFVGTANASQQLTGTLDIPLGANVSSNYDVTVYDDSGACTGISDGTCMDCFTVNAAPMISLSPNCGDQGDSFMVTVTGTGTTWTASHCVEFSDGVSTFSFVGIASGASLLTGTLNIPAGANASANYDVTVYDDNSGNCSGDNDGHCVDCFEVKTGCSISITGITPTPESCAQNDGTLSVDAIGCVGSLEYSLDGVSFQASNVFMDLAAGMYMVTVRCSTDPACTTSSSATVGFENCISITDPCNCLDNATVFDIDANTGGDDGQFSEVVAVTGPGGAPLPPGLIFQVTAVTGGFDAFSIPPVGTQSAGIPIPIGTLLVFNAINGHYEILFVHIENTGYSISVQELIAGAPAGPVLMIANTCAYPNPVFNPALQDEYCPLDPIVILGGIDPGGLGADNVSFTIDGAPATQLDPSALANGNHTVVMTWDGAADGNGGISPDGGVTPAEPGCVQTVQKVIAIDDDPPLIVCPADISITCNDSTDPSNTGTATANDNSTPNPSVVFNDVTGAGDVCSGFDITRTWTATDGCGNTASCDQIITVSPPNPPTIVCPADMTVQCEADIMVNANDATVTTDCNLGFVVYVTQPDIVGARDCDGTTYTYTYKAVDDCGNIGECTQTFTLSNDPPLVTVPAGSTVDCFEDINVDPSDATVTTSCGEELDVTIYTPQVNGVPNCPGTTYTFTYRVEDQCEREVTADRVFTIGNNAPPVIAAPDDVTCECLAGVNANGANALVTTSCDLGYDVAVTGPVIMGAIDCPGTTYTYTYTVTDACGRTASDTQVFTVANDGPEFINAPDVPLQLNCEDEGWEYLIQAWLASVEASTSCGMPVAVSNNYNPNSQGLCISNGTVVVSFFATDQCGRTSSTTGMIIIADTEPPVFVEEAQDEIDICNYNTPAEFDAWVAAYGNAVAYDGCWEDQVTWSTIPNNPSFPNCMGMMGSTSMTVTFVARDGCGNKASTTATFTALMTGGDFADNGGEGVEEQKNRGFALYQNRPNPFREGTIIGFELPQSTSVVLTVYDINGRTIKVIEGEYNEGLHQIRLDRRELGTGLMYYQLTTKQFTATRKMLLVE